MSFSNFDPKTLLFALFFFHLNKPNPFAIFQKIKFSKEEKTHSMFGGSNEKLGPFTQRLMLPQHPLHLLPGAGGSSGSGLGGDDEFPKRDERVPPWSTQETRDFIAIRGELEMEFSSAKRSNLKSLWEIVAARINERGYRRSAEQCKSKWKTLINRYKVFIILIPDKF